jgi:hypothetical protein
VGKARKREKKGGQGRRKARREGKRRRGKRSVGKGHRPNQSRIRNIRREKGVYSKRVIALKKLSEHFYDRQNNFK